MCTTKYILPNQFSFIDLFIWIELFLCILFFIIKTKKIPKCVLDMSYKLYKYRKPSH